MQSFRPAPSAFFERRLLAFAGEIPTGTEAPPTVPVTPEAALTALRAKLTDNTLPPDLLPHMQAEVKRITAAAQGTEQNNARESLQRIATAYYTDLRGRNEAPVTALRSVEAALGVSFLVEGAQLRLDAPPRSREAGELVGTDPDRTPEKLRQYVRTLEKSTEYFISVLNRITPPARQERIKATGIARWILNERYEAFPATRERPQGEVRTQVTAGGFQFLRGNNINTEGNDSFRPGTQALWRPLEGVMPYRGQPYAQLVAECAEINYTWARQLEPAASLTVSSETVVQFDRERPAATLRNVEQDQDAPVVPREGESIFQAWERQWQRNEPLEKEARAVHDELPPALQATAIAQFFKRVQVRSDDGSRFVLTVGVQDALLFKHMCQSLPPSYRTLLPLQVVRDNGNIVQYLITGYTTASLRDTFRHARNMLSTTAAPAEVPEDRRPVLGLFTGTVARPS